MELNEQDIREGIAEIIEIWKPFNQDLQRGKKMKEEGLVPPYYEIYPKMVKYYEDIRVHAEKDVFPEELFRHRSPNQTEEEHDYIRNNYKQKTLPVFMDFVNVVNRSFNDGNWTITWKESEDNNVDGFRKYVEEEIPVHGSVESFMKNVVPTIKLKDANGVICVKPYGEIPTDDEGNYLNGELVDPAPYYYRSDQVVKMNDGEYFYIELDEKSPVKYGTTTKWKGKIFEIYDKQNIWRATQVGKWDDFRFDIELIFAHNIGEVPVTRLMGVQQIMDNEILYQSPFLFSVDCLDLVALNSSNLQVSINNCVYPYRVMVGNICDFMDQDGGQCDGGTVMNNRDGSNYSCPSCQGSGLKSRLSPLGTLLIKPPTDDEPAGEAGITTPMQFVSPSTESLSFLREQIADDMNRAREILHLKDTSDEATGAEDTTATGAAIEQTQMFTFVKPISDQIFDIWSFVLDSIGFMRYGSSYKQQQPSLTPPITFDYFTHDDYLLMINSAVEAGLPPFVIHPLMYKYLQTLFYNDHETAKAFNLITSVDRLLTLTSDQIALKVASGTAAKWEEILHSSATQLIKDIQDDDPLFLDKDLKEQKEILIQKAKDIQMEVGAGMAPLVDTDALVDGLGTGGDVALDAEGNPITGEALSAEAEARAKLKGTVGGLQGIISINQAVGRGEMSESSAELLLQEIYGFAPELAARLIEPTGQNILKE